MSISGESIRISGTVQGVGFRPFVWRLAHQLDLRGEVWNDADGVGIHAWGDREELARFRRRLIAELPPLARIDELVHQPLAVARQLPDDFIISESRQGRAATNVAADAATCPDCLSEILDPKDRRYHYPFTNCTHCGPRLSIIRSIPYDRVNTSMAEFPMCARCRKEYDDPADRRFHAQPNACPDCGPRVWLENGDGEISTDDPIDSACQLLHQGKIVAIKRLGGIHLACDAVNESAVAELRRRKGRYRKPFALRAADLEMVRGYARVDATEQEALLSRAAPIVLLQRNENQIPRLASAVAPAQNTLGFMLPYTPLHHLLLRRLERPLVLTSGNRSEEPQVIGNDQSRQRLAAIADYWLLHDRPIVNRLDDSVQRQMAGGMRLLRRARGYAPDPLRLPAGFERAPRVLAMGAELKNTFCLLNGGRAILSQHMGDLEEAATLADYRHNLALYRRLFEFEADATAVDLHPDYFSTRLGIEMAEQARLPLFQVQHHHAHIAACLAEHGCPLNSPPVLGVALDGLGFGEDGTLWGGEFLLADYRHSRRLACFQPVPMPGGAQAIREPWRNTWAHLQLAIGWNEVSQRYPDLELTRIINSMQLNNITIMIKKGINSPLASSCGRLFDAVAGALGLSPHRISYEGESAMELEAIAEDHLPVESGNGYSGELVESRQGSVLQWGAMWRRLLAEIEDGVPTGVVAARFHAGLADSVVATVVELARPMDRLPAVVLSGGVFQNRLLLEAVEKGLKGQGMEVMLPQSIPTNDGGISLGQAVIAAARFIEEK